MGLVGEKIKLKPIEESDIDDLYSWWNDPQFAGEYAGLDDRSKSRTEVEELVKGAWFFLIESLLGDKKVGFISYYYPVRSDYLYLYEIGYGIKPSERNKGYTTEAVRLLVDYLFSTKKEIERIESVTDVENVPSQRVLEKNGFKREGMPRKRFFKGQYRNEYMYSLLREEWKEPKILTRAVQHQ